MNVTELARKLKTTAQELKDYLPGFGFDIGQRAIKIDNRLAYKIIEKWPSIRKEIEKKKQAALDEIKGIEGSEAIERPKEKIKLPAVITVRDFAEKLGMPVTSVIKELMKNGILASLNERIDYETATIVAEDLGFESEKKDEEGLDEDSFVGDKVKELIEKERGDDSLPRPPVVVVMGHVDHGKTTLLDAIRETHVVESEAGNITQHIGAYQAEHKDKVITFIDTPGHEAFTAMRSRGAKIADIAILVVAADDGIQPQTKEAIKIIEAAKVPFLVAINKIDKEEANIERIKQDLAGLNLIPEDWGGKTICVPVSAKNSEGIDELLEMVLLLADMEKEKIVANPDRCAVGTVIESHVDKGEGAVATILVQMGTLQKNNILSIENTLYGKVRSMKDFRGNLIDSAAPGTPVKIAGLKVAPEVGDILEVKESLKECTSKIKQTYAKKDKPVVKKEAETEGETKKKKLNIVLKTDVLGSLEAVLASLEKFDYEDIGVDIISRGLGNITEADILRGEAVGASVFGFDVLLPPKVEEFARDKGVKVKTFKVIYDLIDEIKKDLEDLLEIEIVTTELGKMEVLAIFRTESSKMIVGGKVSDGKIVFDPKGKGETKIRITRNEGGARMEMGIVLMTQLQAGKVDVKEVEKGEECGIKFKGKTTVKVGDILEIYKEEKRVKKLGE